MKINTKQTASTCLFILLKENIYASCICKKNGKRKREREKDRNGGRALD